jgi:hypothetical protein
MTTGDDQPTQKMPPNPSPALASNREPAAGPWQPAADPGPDDQRTLPAADAQRMLAQTVAAAPKVPETVRISPKPTPPVAGRPGPGPVSDQPTVYQPPVGRPAGQVTIYPRTDNRPVGPAPGEVRRFGPGVPSRAEPDMSRAASIWRGERQSGPDADRPRAGRTLTRWILPLAVLLAVLAVLLWRYSGTSIAVTGVSARAGQQTLGCGGTETVTGVLDTNGEEGTVTYRWQRSDGTTSGTLQQHIAKGTSQSEVALLWSFNGTGTMHATATLEVLSPGSQSVSADFTYSCR